MLIDFSPELPFSHLHLVITDTFFVHFKLCFGLQNIPDYLRPYLVLFQEHLFQSDLFISNSKEQQQILELSTKSGFQPTAKILDLLNEGTVDYRAVVKCLANEFVYYDCGIGFGNDTFSCNWLSDVFIMGGQCQIRETIDDAKMFPIPEQLYQEIRTEINHLSEFEKNVLISIISGISWFFRILIHAEFGGKQLKTTVKTLLSSIVELKRNGNEMASASMTRIIASLAPKIKFPSRSHKIGKLQEQNPFPLNEFDNDSFISMFHQQPFLESISKKLGNNEIIILILNSLENTASYIEVIDSLKNLRVLLFKGNSLGFLQIVLPNVPNQMFIKTYMKSISERLWDYLAGNFKTPKVSNSNIVSQKRPESTPQTSFPYPRSVAKFKENHIDPEIVIPIKGLSSSYLLQSVPCDILSSSNISVHHEDYAAVIVTCELLSRNEGPLFSSIRGRGYAYNSFISCFLWDGLLVFDVSDSILFFLSILII